MDTEDKSGKPKTQHMKGSFLMAKNTARENTPRRSISTQEPSTIINLIRLGSFSIKAERNMKATLRRGRRTAKAHTLTLTDPIMKDSTRMIKDTDRASTSLTMTLTGKGNGCMARERG